jgi:hypothetical protein
MMTDDVFDKDEKGLITLSPLVGYSTATLPDGNFLLRIEFVSSPDQPFDKPHAVQLAMKRQQLTELARALQRLAKTQYVPKPRH